jgi:hypothetical protein
MNCVQKVAAEMALNILAYYLTRVMIIMTVNLIAAMQA